MKFTTLRNLMASMLVVGVAGSVIAVGNGTFALFNATTTNPTNTFSSDNLVFKNTLGGGSACTAQAAGGTTSATCDTITGIPTQMVPGDSKFATLKLENGSASPLGITLTGTVTATTASALTSTAFSSGGLGLLVFRCQQSGADHPCTGGSGTFNLSPLYPSTSACTGTATTAGANLATTDIVPIATANTLTVGGATCTGGNVVVASGSPISVLGFDTVNGTSNAIAATNAVNVAIVMYLPGNAGNTVANSGNTALSFAWAANSVLGTSQ